MAQFSQNLFAALWMGDSFTFGFSALNNVVVFAVGLWFAVCLTQNIFASLWVRVGFLARFNVFDNVSVAAEVSIF